MKLLHTGDWHLGKRLYGSDRLDEAERALDQIAEVAAAEAVDAILIAGDLLDRRLVDSAALGACLRAMERLAATAPVLAIAGNHDDPDLWGHLAPYLGAHGIHVAGRVRPAEQAVVSVPTPAGPLHAALLPWPEPAPHVASRPGPAPRRRGCGTPTGWPPWWAATRRRRASAAPATAASRSCWPT